MKLRNSPNLTILHYDDKTNKTSNFLEGDQKIEKLQKYFYDLFSEFSDRDPKETYFDVICFNFEKNLRISFMLKNDYTKIHH